MKYFYSFIIITFGVIIISCSAYSISPNHPNQYVSAFINPIIFTGTNSDYYKLSWGVDLNYDYDFCEYLEGGVTFGYTMYNFKNSPPPNVTWDMHAFDAGIGARLYMHNRYENPCSWGMNPYVGFNAGAYFITDSYKYTVNNYTQSSTTNETKFWINPNVGVTYQLTDRINFDLKLGYNSIATTPKSTTYLNIGLGAGYSF